MTTRQEVNLNNFNFNLDMPYNLRTVDFQLAMQDVYDFFYDVNTDLRSKNLSRLDDMLRPANLSGTISDMMTDALAKHSRSLVVNGMHNGHPDLLVRGMYANDSISSGTEGVEIKSTTRRGGAVDTHGGRSQWMCAIVYEIDRASQPVDARSSLIFREIYLAHVEPEDFRNNARGVLGTRTSTLDAYGVEKLRNSWVYLDQPNPIRKRG